MWFFRYFLVYRFFNFRRDHSWDRSRSVEFVWRKAVGWGHFKIPILSGGSCGFRVFSLVPPWAQTKKNLRLRRSQSVNFAASSQRFHSFLLREKTPVREILHPSLGGGCGQLRRLSMTTDDERDIQKIWLGEAWAESETQISNILVSSLIWHYPARMKEFGTWLGVYNCKDSNVCRVAIYDFRKFLLTFLVFASP